MNGLSNKTLLFWQIITTTIYKCKIKDVTLVIEKTDNTTTNFWFQYLKDKIDDNLLKELCSLLIKLNFCK